MVNPGLIGVETNSSLYLYSVDTGREARLVDQFDAAVCDQSRLDAKTIGINIDSLEILKVRFSEDSVISSGARSKSRSRMGSKQEQRQTIDATDDTDFIK